MVFQYDEKAMDYLKKKDKKLGIVIDRLGVLSIEINNDIFCSVVHQIIAQQISTSAQATIAERLTKMVGKITAENVASITDEALQSIGISWKKVSYIKRFAHDVIDGVIDIESLPSLSDQEIVSKLTQLPGIGVWTAEMLLIFSMNRMDVLSYSDLGILRGMRMVYHHQFIDKTRFERYKKRYSPYGSVASLYLWAISNGK